jgi:hypothetical protein
MNLVTILMARSTEMSPMEAAAKARASTSDPDLALIGALLLGIPIIALM